MMWADDGDEWMLRSKSHNGLRWLGVGTSDSEEDERRMRNKIGKERVCLLDEGRMGEKQTAGCEDHGQPYNLEGRTS